MGRAGYAGKLPVEAARGFAALLSIAMIAAPVRCSVNDDAGDSGAPVALSPTSRTRQTSGPSTPINPWATVWM